MNDLKVVALVNGVKIRLRVAPNAKQALIKGVHAGALKLSVSEPPEKGKANSGVQKLLAKALNIPARDVEIIAGLSSQDKVVLISNIDAATLTSRLTEYLTGK